MYVRSNYLKIRTYVWVLTYKNCVKNAMFKLEIRIFDGLDYVLTTVN